MDQVELDQQIQSNGEAIFNDLQRRNWARTDRMFAALLAFQWVFGIVIAFFVSPRTWSGIESAIHPHLVAAVLLGCVIAALPIALALRQPGALSTRIVIAIAQMLYASLLIHLTGGRIETHFHIFGSLAFLAFYRDFRVLIVATGVIAADHLLRGMFLPLSVFGVLTASPWRALEHAGWVIFEDVILFRAIIVQLQDMRTVATRQAMLEQTNDLIECEVRVRTEELELRRAEAVESARLKSEFLANMSHEIRTPMNGVIGMTELLLATEQTPLQEDYTETIRSSADALLRILNDILDLSKIEAGRLIMEYRGMHIPRLAEDTLALMQHVAADKGIEIIFDHPPHIHCTYVGDEVRIRQVLTNLLGNAIKFTEHGEVVVRIEAVPGANSMSEVRFEISDTGIGIPEDRLEDVFGAFIQADGSTTRRYGGTGLGLSICKRLVEMMGGTIGVQSEPGKGSTFWFKLTMERIDDDLAPEVNPMDVQRGSRMLIVDDSAVNRRLLRDHLAAGGYQTSEAIGPYEAIQLAKEEGKWDFVLLDDAMPAIAGRDLARQLRKFESCANSCIVLLSSSIDYITHAETVAWQIDGWLAKPIRIRQLQNVLRQALGGSQRAVKKMLAAPEPVETSPLVLVVEDNSVNQRVAERTLQLLGCRVEIAPNGLMAVEKCRDNAYDLVLMDVQMPEMSGTEATQEIRKEEAASGRNQLIVAMTAHALDGDREACLEVGMNDYLSKPLRRADLEDMMDRWDVRKAA